MKRVVLGFFGNVLDYAGNRESRWERWRPSLALLHHPELEIARFELLVGSRWYPSAKQLAEDMRRVSPELEVALHLVELEDPWNFEQVYQVLHEFARKYPFEPGKEDYLIHITTGTHVVQICLFLLTEARFFPGRLIQAGPKGDKGKQAGSFTIIDLDLSRYDLLATRFADERRESQDFLKSGIQTRSPNFNAMIEEIEKVAIHSRAPILLSGPTGAGKSQLARRVYELKRARHQLEGAFVELNCATLRGDAAMSALFGHVRGAFTGAASERAGLLRAAHGGLIFLDEIGELGLDVQAMLLRALEEKTFFPVGADREASSDFQLISGTNRDLRERVRKGLFREDLLARIDLWSYQLPPLKARKEDLEPNLIYELERFSRRENRAVHFNREALRRYLDFAIGPEGEWRGNFRDLNASLTRMATLARSGRIDEDAVTAELERLRRSWRSDEPTSLLNGYLSEEQLSELDLFDRLQLEAVLRVCQKSRSLAEAGRQLFAASRAGKKSSNDSDRLRKYLARFNLHHERVFSS